MQRRDWGCVDGLAIARRFVGVRFCTYTLVFGLNFAHDLDDMCLFFMEFD